MAATDKILARKEGRVGTLVFNNPGAAEALAMGVVNKVLSDGELAGFVCDYATTIAENAPLTISAVKQISIEAMKPEDERNLGLAADLVARCFASQDYVEGRNACMQKLFTGR